MGLLSGITDTIFGGESKQNQFVDKDQQKHLVALREQAAAQLAAQGPQQAAAGFNLSRDLSQQAGGFIDQLAQPGQAGNQLDPFTSGGFVDEQVESLTDILNRNLNFNLQGIQSQFGQAGTTGDRANVTAQTALGDTQLALSAGITDIFSSNRMMDQQAATNQFQGGFMQQALNQQGLQAGLNATPGQFDLGMAGFANAQQPLANFANLIGQPTVLGQSQGGRQGLVGAATGAASAYGSVLSGIGSILG